MSESNMHPMESVEIGGMHLLLNNSQPAEGVDAAKWQVWHRLVAYWFARSLGAQPIDTPDEQWDEASLREYYRVPAPQVGVPVEVQPPQHVREYVMLALAEQGIEVDGEALRFVVYNDAPKDAWLTEQMNMQLPPEVREALETIWHAANLFDASMRGFHTNNGKLAAALQTCGQWLDSQRPAPGQGGNDE